MLVKKGALVPRAASGLSALLFVMGCLLGDGAPFGWGALVSLASVVIAIVYAGHQRRYIALAVSIASLVGNSYGYLIYHAHG